MTNKKLLSILLAAAVALAADYYGYLKRENKEAKYNLGLAVQKALLAAFLGNQLPE